MSEEIRLNSSKLGTKEYWNNLYKKEIGNFYQNDEDLGECWFDDSDAEYKIILHLADNLESGEYSFDSQISVLDLGTGNGHLLFELNEELLQRSIANSFTYTGIDYSPDSVAFCKELAPSKYPNGSFTFDLVDLLSQDEPFLNNKFDIILDKGTLDAIALNQDPIPGFDKIGMDIYASQVVKMMSSKSILLVTSCNFTEDELIKIITSNTSLKVMKRIAYPSYEYNGVKGSTICSVSFQMS